MSPLTNFILANIQTTHGATNVAGWASSSLSRFQSSSLFSLQIPFSLALVHLGEKSKFPFCGHKQTTEDDTRR